jgi:outer membrane lipoprotein-sorting protein
MKSVDHLEKTIRNKLSFTADGRLHNRILTEVLAAHEESKQGKSDPLLRNIRRVVMYSRIMKLAAALIIVGISVGICYITRDTHSSVAFADVVKQMQQIRTATWTEIGESHPPKNLPQGAIFVGGSHIRRCAYKAPGYERQDTTQTLVDPQTRQPGEYKTFHIIDRNAGKALLLNPQEMTAAIHSFEPNVHQNALYDVFLNLPENISSDAQSLGTKQIGNREAIGFRLQKKTDGTYPWSGDITDIWVDAKTRLLVMLETGAADGGWMFRLKDFAFNQELDDSLFSLDPPQGYRMLIPPPEILSVEPPKQD